MANSDVWAVVGSVGEELQELLDEGACAAAPLRMCRAVLDGGVLVLGAADPHADRLFTVAQADARERGESR